ncbi:MAG: hypothetical protein M3Z85_21795, partial [Acidobacteriota bacterium]|nr:hypothetical protein [Acidobacteriota bacterium]
MQLDVGRWTLSVERWTFLLLLFAAPSLRSATMGIQEPAGYSTRIDGTGSDIIYDTTTDGAGNVYVVGRTLSPELNIDVIRDRADDQTGRYAVAAHDALVASPSGGGFIIKYNREGNIVWRRFAGPSNNALISGVTVDASGNVFVSGDFEAQLILGGITLTPSSRSNVNFNNTRPENAPLRNVFVASLDPDGNWQWARQFDYALFASSVTSSVNPGTDVTVPFLRIGTTPGGHAPMDGQASTLAIDTDGSLFVRMIAQTNSLGVLPDGIYWMRTPGTGKIAIAYRKAPTGSNYDSVFVARLAATPPPFGSPAGTLATYDWRWVAPMNSGIVTDTNNTVTFFDTSTSINTLQMSTTGFTLDFNGSLYVVGTWIGKLVAGGAARTSGTSADGFVVRLRTTDATPIYLATFRNDTNGGDASFGGGIAVDEDRNVFVEGAARNTTTLRLTSADNSILTRPLTATDSTRTACFLGKLSPNGTWLWSEAPNLVVTNGAGSFPTARLTSITRDAAGSLYLGGALRGGCADLVFPVAGSVSTCPNFDGLERNEAFVAKLTEDTVAATRTWNWVLQTDLVANPGVKIMDTAKVDAGGGSGTVYWSLNTFQFSSNAMTRFASARSPNAADQPLDTVQSDGSWLLPILTDASLPSNKPAISSEFAVTKAVLCGREVVPPAGIFRDATNKALQPDITLPGAGNANGAANFYWDTFEAKLYAVDPQTADVRWKVSSDPLNARRIKQRVVTAWPTPAQGLITQATGAGPNGDEPKVSLEPPTINNTFQSILYQSNNAQISGAKLFSSKAAGYSVLLYTTGKNTAPGTAPVSLDVVRTYLWPDPAVKSDATAAIGREISGAAYNHSDPSGKNGYIVNAKARFDGTGPGAAYDRIAQLGTIIPVNKDEPTPDDDMVIIWSNLNPRGVSWPAKAVQYNCVWGALDSIIVIATTKGSETVVPGLPALSLDPAKYQFLSVYHQPDKNLAGYNPNEEHAFLAPSNGVSAFLAVFALRSDLNHLGRTTSDPYVLVRYKDATDNSKPKMLVCKVTPEDPDGNLLVAPATFLNYPGTAGTLVQPPYPLPLLDPGAGTSATGVASFVDRKSQVWARAAGGIMARYFYQLRADFWYDLNGDGVQDSVTSVPWLDRYNHDTYGGAYGTPIAINYNITWPANVPMIAVGDTLTSARNGLPDVESMASATIIYEEANPTLSNPANGSVRFIDYTTERKVALNAAINGQNLVLGPTSFAVESITDGRYRFRDLPYELKIRVSFDPVNKQLVFGGYKNTSGAGVPLVLVNVLSTRERNRMLAFDGTPTNAAWDAAINSLYSLSRNPNGVTGGAADQYFVGLKGTAAAPTYADALGPKALTAGKASGLGYVTIVENNAASLAPAVPIKLHIMRVVNPPVVGEIKVVFSDNALDEKVTLRHSNDFAGDPDNLFFEWYYQPATTPTSPSPPDPGNPTGSGGWILLASGNGANDVVIQGAGLRTLADMWVFCRYRGYTAGGFNPNTFTDWAGDPSSTPIDRRAAFVPGWIKRVLTGIGPFEARVKDFASAPTQTYSSFIAQAGARYEGAVALSSDATNLNNLGLISLYETVLQRGFDLSINGSPPDTNVAVNNALLLVSTRISDFYMLLGNEAYADAQDPTIGFRTTDGAVGNLAPSVFAFSNQLPNLISEELALLRGRDNSSAGVGAAPVYNRLFWNFTGGIEGEPVYVQNYGITDQNADGVINATDARILFPQGHGDAWGHYLTAVKKHYRLLRDPVYTWIPRTESTLVAGVAIEVDYADEVKFARAAAARARAGAEIVNLTYRDRYVADPSGQWQGYRDTDTTRAWGVDEWARRAGEGAYFDWVTANAILPAVHTAPLQHPGGPPPSGLQKIDRTTVTELREIAAAYSKVQSQMDQADQGLNPLGVTPGSIPFDIDPAFLIIGSGIQGKKHFEQIYERTLASLKSARQVFDHANELTQRLRQTQISADAFAQDSLETEMDFRNRLIEIFGYPYAGDIGTSKTYPTGYNGPDLYHYNYVAVNDVSGTIVAPNTTLTGFFTGFAEQYQAPPGGATTPSDFQQITRHYFSNDVVDPNVSVSGPLAVSFPLATAASWSFAAPSEWGQRRAPGTLQLAIADMVRSEAELRRGIITYNNHLAQIKDELDLLQARFNLQSSQINILDKRRNTIIGMNAAIGTLQGISVASSTSADILERVVDGTAEAIPKVVGLAIDVFAPIRGIAKIAGGIGFGLLKV